MVNAIVSANTLDELLNMMNKAEENSKGKKWSRKDIYDRKVFVDTNILVYSQDNNFPKKKVQNREIVLKC